MSDFEEQNIVITDQILIKSLKNLIFGCVAPGHWNSRKIEIVVLFWQISLFWPQCIPIMIQQSKKMVQSCFNTDFEIFTKKLGVLPRLPEYPGCQRSICFKYKTGIKGDGLAQQWLSCPNNWTHYTETKESG